MFHFNTALMAGAVDGEGVFEVFVPPNSFVVKRVSEVPLWKYLSLVVFNPDYTWNHPRSFKKYIHLGPYQCGSVVGRCPVKQKVASLIPGQGTCLGCGFGP